MSADNPLRKIRQRAREGVLEQKPVGGKSRKARPFTLEYLWEREFGCSFRKDGWWKLGDYISESAAMEVAKRKQRSQYVYTTDYGKPKPLMRFRLNGVEFLIGEAAISESPSP